MNFIGKNLKMIKQLGLAVLLSTFAGYVSAGQENQSIDSTRSIGAKTIPIYSLNQETAKQGIGDEIGSMTLQDTAEGLKLTLDLQSIPPGEHGFHVHETPSCAGQVKDGVLVPGSLAGGHFDPEATQVHLGPYQQGHLGDLPKLMADENGQVKESVLAPRLTIAQIMNRSVIIHASGDNYADAPAPLGGGGARIACGVIN